MTEVEDVDAKIAALDNIRTDLKKALLNLKEEELELADESAFVNFQSAIVLIECSVEGVNERLLELEVRSQSSDTAPSTKWTTNGSWNFSSAQRTCFFAL